MTKMDLKIKRNIKVYYKKLKNKTHFLWGGFLTAFHFLLGS